MATIATIVLGTVANDDTGEGLRLGGVKINDNFAALNAEAVANTAAIAALGALAALNTVGTSQIDNDAVTALKIAANAVETAKINALAVTAAKIAANAVETAKVNDGAITRPKLGARSIDAQTDTAHSIVAADQNGVVTMDNVAANTVTINTNATTALNVGHQTDIIQIGAGVTTIDAAVGVTLNGVSGGSVAITDQFKPATILKVATDTWIIFGAIGTVA